MDPAFTYIKNLEPNSDSDRYGIQNPGIFIKYANFKFDFVEERISIRNKNHIEDVCTGVDHFF
jgi:hypothetical protein